MTPAWGHLIATLMMQGQPIPVGTPEGCRSAVLSSLCKTRERAHGAGEIMKQINAGRVGARD